MAVQLLLVLALLRLATGETSPIAQPRCPSSCGGVSIPYPFGVGPGCFLDGFEITCNHSIPYLGRTNIDVVQINLTQGLLVVNQYIATDCYNADASLNAHNDPFINLLGMPNFKFSDDRNRFTAVGCDTVGLISDIEDKFQTGCISICNDSAAIINGSCSGIGCCDAPIPSGLRAFQISIGSIYNHTNSWNFSPCSYAFVADQGWLGFSLSNFTDLRNVSDVPVTLDWAIMGQTCEQAQRNRTAAYACVSPNSSCFNSTNGPGYLCNCSEGFQGNPYLHGDGGCQDINECEAGESPCVKKCTNTEGSYSCSCPWYMYGDGKRNGTGCRSMLTILYICLGVGLSILILVAMGSWIYWICKKRKDMKMRQKFFQQNGGSLLQQQIQGGGAGSATRVFSEEELRVATEDYKQSRILGEGAAGRVYQGVLPDRTVVAIKRSKITDGVGIQQFINEVVVLSHIKHRHVVKLLGCCLETPVPMLVYEFVPNGTLGHHIHEEGRKGSLSLSDRLRIASEVAGSLSYLHSAASTPIIHRDIKSSNILLDKDLTAKVADFGCSRLVPVDQSALISIVRGTHGYLDPEYMQTGQFRDKSDVYSFGVVLVELLTGKKVVDKKRPVDSIGLATLFMRYAGSGDRLLQILEERVVRDGTIELLQAVAELALRCLSLSGDNRPSMKEVAMELEGLANWFKAHPWANNEADLDEESSLIGEAKCSTSTSVHHGYDDSIGPMMAFNVMR